jgi:hypothetical protein
MSSPRRRKLGRLSTETSGVSEESSAFSEEAGTTVGRAGRD